MKTKLVYVLTCAPEATYIEQALMAVWSARHWNQDAHIVLIVDDKTDSLLIGKRAEIMDYISEKIVVPFMDELLTPMYRSRWIKTQVRQLVQGDFLFVDCDTICCKGLNEVDDFNFEIGATGDNNLPFQKDGDKNNTILQVSPLCDISNEEYYFSSGVLYCKDTERVHKLFSLWHQYWQEGSNLGLKIDQPSLAKANIDLNHLITPIDDIYNSVLYTQNSLLYKASILHISNFPETSYLFKQKTLTTIRKEGITSWIAELILNVHATYLPYDYSIKHSSFTKRKQWIRDISYAAKIYGRYVDDRYSEWYMRVRIEPLIKKLFKLNLYTLGALLWVEFQRAKLSRKNSIKSNVCAE